MVEALRPPRGGFLRPFGCGQFIRAYLAGEGPYGSTAVDPARGAPIEDIRSAYKNALLRAHAEDFVAMAMEKGIELSLEEALRRIPHRLTKMRSHSFYRYFHNLKMLGWVELTGEEEGSLMGGVPGARVERTAEGTTLVEVPQPRRYYRLTPAGREASQAAWGDPIQAIYAYPREFRSGRKETRLARAACPAGARESFSTYQPPRTKTRKSPLRLFLFFCPRSQGQSSAIEHISSSPFTFGLFVQNLTMKAVEAEHLYKHQLGR